MLLTDITHEGRFANHEVGSSGPRVSTVDCSVLFRFSTPSPFVPSLKARFCLTALASPSGLVFGKPVRAANCRRGQLDS
jgi:hypothetical protein